MPLMTICHNYSQKDLVGNESVNTLKRERNEFHRIEQPKIFGWYANPDFIEQESTIKILSRFCFQFDS